jgi:SAM-dependent methyltransferase
MRDPRGRLRFEGDRALRQLEAPYEAPLFLSHPVAQQLVGAGALIPFELSLAIPGQIESPRYGFISFPTEWTDAQLLAAADLTLDIAEKALAPGFELKDASAWNVVFDGTVPRFCDHLSFEPIVSRQWWAFGQFCRHFILPLACSRWRGLPARGAFQLHRDGLDIDRARAMLGLRGRMSRLAPLLFRSSSSDGDATPVVQPAICGKPTLHRSLIAYARRSLIAPKRTTASTGWSGYVQERPHYPAQAARTKLDQVRQWLGEAEPHTVLDLGCNTGEFSRLALEFAQRVIAVDADHDCVQRLFLDARGNTRLHPLVADLGDLCGGRGWAATEFAGLIDRLAGQVDMTLMLALVHHLHISEGIPLPEIAALAARLTTRDLIVELLEPNDPMVQVIAKQRRRSLEGFAVDQQLSAFKDHFELQRREQLPATHRHLMWMRLRA